MRSRRHRLLPVSVLLLLTVISATAVAQPLGRHDPSVESLIAPAEFAAFGYIKSVQENVFVQPGGVDESGRLRERGEFEYVIQTEFTEILKKVGRAGDAGEFDTFRTVDRYAGRNEQIALLAKDETAGLWIVYPQHAREKFRRWTFMPFDRPGVNHFGYSSSSITPPMFARDLSILTTHEQIVRRLRDYGPISEREHDSTASSVASIRIPFEVLGDIEPGDFNQLSLPIDSQLPFTARRLIESPADFLAPDVAARRQDAMDSLCEAGIVLLGSMKTESSIGLLKDCLDASVLPFAHSERAYRIRTRAYEQLLDWRMNPPRPRFASKVTVLSLASSDINDDTLALVAEFENLEVLILWDTEITHVGLAHLAALKHLKELAVGDAHLTDQALQTLRKNDQLHLISQATTEGQDNRPESIEDVARIRFWCAPFTDAGLKEFSSCRNLISIDLGRMDITDASVEQLAMFEKLKFAVLDETSVTQQGAARLRAALPDCSVELR